MKRGKGVGRPEGFALEGSSPKCPPLYEPSQSTMPFSHYFRSISWNVKWLASIIRKIGLLKVKMTELSMGKLAKKLILWIGERVSGAGSKGVALEMSSGIDSSVVAVLCQRVFPEATWELSYPATAI